VAKLPQKPTLSLVGPELSPIPPPRKLGKFGTALWNAVQGEYAITDTGGVEILAQICAALDRAEALAACIARDGDVILTRTGVPKCHPAVREELAARAFVVRGLERLGLNIEAIKPMGRPARPFGWAPDAS
jgi:tRNA C32,U32 (ribose-2'-O)-methylase TrmJ